MNTAVILATHGGEEWRRLARTRALPSALCQGAAEVIPVHLANGTLAQARNVGAAKAEAEWLCFLDADDELAPGYLQAMIAGAPPRFPDSEDAYPLALLVPAVQYVRCGKVTPPKVLDRGQPLYELNWAVIGTLIPRELFLDLGGFEELPALEDWSLWLRAERAGARLFAVPDAVYRVHVREGSRNVDQSLYREIRGRYEGVAA